MVKLTALHYKLKMSSLERYHKIAEHNAGLMFNWEQAEERARSVGDNYPPKPFIEPFEFQDDDYLIKEKAFRIRLEDIYSYKENADNVVEVTVAGDISYTVKETIAELDALFGI